MVAMLRGGGVMLPKPRALHTKELMAASNLSGLTACSHAICFTLAGTHSSHAVTLWSETKRPKWFQIAGQLLEPTAAMQSHSEVKQKDLNGIHSVCCIQERVKAGFLS